MTYLPISIFEEPILPQNLPLTCTHGKTKTITLHTYYIYYIHNLPLHGNDDEMKPFIIQRESWIWYCNTDTQYLL